MRERFGLYFEGSMGAAAIQKRLENFDLEAEAESLREIIRDRPGAAQDARAQAAQGRLGVPDHPQHRPMGMVLDCVPVIPPDLRPMVQLDGGRFATSAT